MKTISMNLEALMNINGNNDINRYTRGIKIDDFYLTGQLLFSSHSWLPEYNSVNQLVTKYLCTQYTI